MCANTRIHCFLWRIIHILGESMVPAALFSTFLSCRFFVAIFVWNDSVFLFCFFLASFENIFRCQLRMVFIPLQHIKASSRTQWSSFHQHFTYKLYIKAFTFFSYFHCVQWNGSKISNVWFISFLLSSFCYFYLIFNIFFSFCLLYSTQHNPP